MPGILRSFWSVQLIQLLPEWLFYDFNIVIYLPELKPTNDFLLLFSGSVLSNPYPMDCSTAGFPVLYHLPELTQTRPLSRWCHPTISFSVIPFYSWSFPTSRSFPVNQSSHQVAKVLELQLQHQSFQWIFRTPLGLTGWISLQSKGLWKVFSNTTVQKHHFFDTLPFLWSNYHICTWLMEKP